MIICNRLRAALGGAFLIGSAVSLAGETCYDFSGMAVGTSYGIDQEVVIENGRGERIGKVRIRKFIKDGAEFTPINGTIQQLKISQSMIAKEASPEVALTYVGMQLIPVKPVKEVTMLVAQNLGRDGSRPAYIEINGERHDFSGSFNLADEREMGNLPAGRARFKASLEQDAAGANGQSTWHRGRLGAVAVEGGIESFTIGSFAAHIDMVCFKSP